MKCAGIILAYVIIYNYMKEENEEEFIDPNQLGIPFDWSGNEIKTTEQLEEQDRAYIRQMGITTDTQYV
jgi:hypothetical protein